jgi:hypothetical protein
MRTLFGLAFFALFLVIGCGKKTEPEAAPDAAGVTADLARLVVIRKEVVGTAEKPTYRGVLNVNNGYNTAISLVRVEYSGTVGRLTMPDSLEQLDLSVPANGSTEVRLDARFSWKDDAPMEFQRATLTGTVYYRGPKGNLRELPFSVDGAPTIRGD